MNTYRFILDIPANSEKEAQAKLDLMLQLATFCKDFNVNHLAASYVNYLVWNKLGKYLEPKQTPSPAGTANNSTKAGNG